MGSFTVVLVLWSQSFITFKEPRCRLRLRFLPFLVHLAFQLQRILPRQTTHVLWKLEYKKA